MPDLLVFGATGYTGRLTARALQRRGASFAVAGRNLDKLRALANETDAEDARRAEIGDIDALVAALDDVKVILTLVGPFAELGQTAVEAALRAGVHYVDSTGEGPFIGRLIEERSEAARAAGIAMAPAMGFDEVPADVAAARACEDMPQAELILTYAVPTAPSAGTLRTILGLVGAPGQWIVDGQKVAMRALQEERWAPMPAPLGPRDSVAFPLAEGFLAPLHIDLRTLKTFVSVGRFEKIRMRVAWPFLRALTAADPVRRTLQKAIPGTGGPGEDTRQKGKWTILAEARSGTEWRNVALTGTDVYGLTAELLATAALAMAEDGYDRTGVLSPVQAVGLDVLEKELVDNGVSLETFEPGG